jgi:hypothetical protein
MSAADRLAEALRAEHAAVYAYGASMVRRSPPRNRPRPRTGSGAARWWHGSRRSARPPR